MACGEAPGMRVLVGREDRQSRFGGNEELLVDFGPNGRAVDGFTPTMNWIHRGGSR